MSEQKIITKAIVYHHPDEADNFIEALGDTKSILVKCICQVLGQYHMSIEPMQCKPNKIDNLYIPGLKCDIGCIKYLECRVLNKEAWERIDKEY